MSNVQAAVTAAVTQLVALLVSFAILNNTEAGVVVSSCAAIVNLAFVVGQAIENHGKGKAPAK